MADVRSSNGTPALGAFGSATGTPLVIDVTNALAYFLDSSNNIVQLGTGSVSSVGLSAPSQFAVTGSPVTGSGTLALSWNNQTANTVLAGPTSGGAAAPTFRALVADDLPAGIGTVTSVAQTVPVEFSIAGSPVTTSGTLAITKATQSANTVWAGPTTGLDAQPAFRALVAEDIPSGVSAALITVANEATDTTCFPVFVTAATGDLGPKSNANLQFNSSATGGLTALGLSTIAGSSAPGVSVGATKSWVSGTSPISSFVESSRTANNRIADIVFTNAGVLSFRFVNDAYSAATNIMTATGGHGAGISAIAFPSSAPITMANNLSVTGNLSSTGTGGTINAASLSAFGGTVPGVASSRIHAFVTSALADVYWVTAGGSANNRTADILKTTTGLSVRFINDAASAATDAMVITGGQAAGVTLIAYPTAVSNVFGHTASVTVGNAGRFQVTGTTAATAQMQASGFAADATTAGTLALSKSRNATAGSNTIVQADDVLGAMVAYGADGTNYDTAAAIRFEVDGTPAAGADMPGRVVCLTSPDGSATLTEAWRVDNAQKHIFQVDRAVRFNNQTSAAAANVGTLNNAPTAGDPGYWLKINIGGTNYALPAWAG
jgi:hypothetical protein